MSIGKPSLKFKIFNYSRCHCNNKKKKSLLVPICPSVCLSLTVLTAYSVPHFSVKMGILLKLAVMPQVALIYPQIPPNTGNIARTCAATGTALHLVGPLGFEISDRTLKRAGLDYWPYVDVHYHETLAAFQAWHAQQGGRWIGFATKGAQNYIHFRFAADDWLLFGSETEGLPPEVLVACQATVYIPMAQAQVRSLNLSVSAALGLFEARRQLGYLG